MPLLARTVATPLAIDVRRGAVAGLGELLADRRISAGGDVDVVGYAPRTRPGRYTILEHLDLTPAQVRARLADYVDAVGFLP
jgi:hypothetical protein